MTVPVSDRDWITSAASMTVSGLWQMTVLTRLNGLERSPSARVLIETGLATAMIVLDFAEQRQTSPSLVRRKVEGEWAPGGEGSACELHRVWSKIRQ